MTELDQEKSELVAEIHRVFIGVSREGGTSWREAEIEDYYGHEEWATHIDTDSCWQDLIDDDKWDPSPGIGGFSFLDSIGFRYFLPAAMLRCIRSGCDEGILFHLTVPAANSPSRLRQYNLDQLSLLTVEQMRCVRRFIEYMIALGRTFEHGGDAEWWQEALDSYWGEVN